MSLGFWDKPIHFGLHYHCPKCGAVPGAECVTPKGNPSPGYTHRARLDAMQRLGRDRQRVLAMQHATPTPEGVPDTA